jgi:hypothetical protein
MSADCVLSAVNDVLNRIPLSSGLYSSRLYDIGASDLGHDYPPEWRKRDVLWIATLIDNFATLATARGLFLPGFGDAVRGHLLVTLWTLSSDIHSGCEFAFRVSFFTLGTSSRKNDFARMTGGMRAPTYWS